MSDLPNNWNVIINPAALRGQSIAYWKKASKLLVENGFKFTEWHTSNKNDALHLAKEIIQGGGTSILVVGGDGTLNEVVNGIMQCQSKAETVTLAVLPAGTGNDWSRTHQIPKHPKQILQMFLSGKLIKHDIGVVEVVNENSTSSRFFINIAGLGFDAAVIERVHQSRKFKVAKGLVYVKHLLLTLFSYQAVDCELVFDETSYKGSVFSIAVGICKYNGNGMKPVPMADPTDRFLDVVVIEKMSLISIISQIPALFKGTHIQHPKVHHFRTSKVEVNPEGFMLAEVEGEIVGSGKFEISIAPQTITVLVSS